MDMGPFSCGWLAHSAEGKLVATALSWGSLGFESLLPLVVLSGVAHRLVRPLFVASVLFFHLAIQLMMHINFLGQLWVLCVFVPLKPAPVPAPPPRPRGDGTAGLGGGAAADEVEEGDDDDDRDEFVGLGGDGERQEEEQEELSVAIDALRAVAASAVGAAWLAQVGSDHDLLWPVTNVPMFSYAKGHPCYQC